MVIDFHTHVFPPQIKAERRRYATRDSTFASIYADPKARLATTEELIASMDRDGVAVSVITGYGWVTPELCRETNDYILESVARYPQRLIGFCSLPVQSSEVAIAEIERCVAGGIRGVGEIRPDLQPIDSELAAALAATLKKHNLILLTHASEPVGHVYPGKGSATPGLLYPLLTSLADIPVVCAHWGGGLPFYALMPEGRQALKNVYFDTAASPFLYHPQIYPLVSQLIGADKILFGSDYPLMPPRRLLKEINAATLTDEARELILAGNARRLLGIKD